MTHVSTWSRSASYTGGSLFCYWWLWNCSDNVSKYILNLIQEYFPHCEILYSLLNILVPRPLVWKQDYLQYWMIAITAWYNKTMQISILNSLQFEGVVTSHAHRSIYDHNQNCWTAKIVLCEPCQSYNLWEGIQMPSSKTTTTTKKQRLMNNYFVL